MHANDLPVVQTAGLTKTFKDFWRRDRVVAVHDLNVEVRPGEVFGLLGPNGSGKSTTIKMLLGLLYPSQGRISIFGRPPTDVAIKARIGFLPEESFLYRFLNARETLDLYGRIFRLHPRVRNDRINKLLDMVGLTSESKRRIGEYSKGMARRIGLAQALINDPDFLILDEPTAGLDPIGIRQIKDVIRRLAEKGKTILLSSHLLGDVEDACDHITILYGGRQRAAGTIHDLLRRHDRTQIVTERIAPETVEKIRELIQNLEHKDILSVGEPADRLESFFLQTVEKAQAENIASSGARMGGEMPDFLLDDQKTDLIQSLVAAAEKPVIPPPTEPTESPVPRKQKETDRSVIELLTQTEPEPKQPPAEEPAPVVEDDAPDAPPEPPRRQAPQADRAVIEQLIQHPGHDDD